MLLLCVLCSLCVLVLKMMAAALIAISVWWNANTISHLFIHRPFFRNRAANAWFAALLTAALGFPQALWRDRHLAHHGGRRYRLRVTREIALQAALVGSLWLMMALQAPTFFATVYLPGYLLGLTLCAVHGRYEHAGGTTSHYGRLYNALCFNDGYHVEHHRHPYAPWWTLPRYRELASRESAWPAPLRWLEHGPQGARPLLTALERLVLRAPWLQRWVVRTHARAFDRLLEGAPAPRHVAIVGGGLFPRTALVLRRLLPDAQLTIIEADAQHLERARAFLRDESVMFVHAHFTVKCEINKSQINLNSEICNLKSTVLVVPLSFDGDRSAIYANPPAAAVIVHDWIWRRRGTSRIVSPLLLKRINLVRG